MHKTNAIKTLIFLSLKHFFIQILNFKSDAGYAGGLDFETNPFYLAIITVSDGTLSTTVELALNIRNENEAPPLFLNQGKEKLSLNYLHVHEFLSIQ